MKRFLRSKVFLTLCTLVLLAGAIAIPLAGSIGRSHAAAPTTSTGGLWATGHDVDFHCSQASLQCHYLRVAVDFVRNGSTLPILALDHRTQVATAISNPNTYPSGAPQVVTKDPRSQFAGLQLVNAGKPVYSAIIIASDITCGGTPPCDNNDAEGIVPDTIAINKRANDIAAFFKAGGGILALAGAQNALAGGSNVNLYYDFLPIPVVATAVTPANGSPGGFSLTPLGQSLGLVGGQGNTSDINCCQTHNSFLTPAADTGLQVAETDSAGNAETLIAKPTAPRRDLFVLLQGLSSEFTPIQVSQGRHPGFNQSNGITTYLQSKNGGFGSADFLEYSYPVDFPPNTPPGARRFILETPHIYSCSDTFDHTLDQDIRTLDLQIRFYLNQSGHQNTDVHLIGDSLGGAVAFGYLGLLKGQGWPSLPNGGQLKDTTSLDAPLGGIPAGDNVITQAVFDAKCGRLITSPIKPLEEFGKVFDTTHNSTPLGGMAKLAQVVFPKVSLLNGVTNQMLADEAVKHGIHVLTVGNLRDYGFVPANCTFLKSQFPPLNFVLSNYPSSQFVEDEGFPSGVYGREIDSGLPVCTLAVIQQANHLETLTNVTVEQGIVDFLVNNNPDPLAIPK